MAGLIAMASVFFVVVIEMIFSTLNGANVGGCHGGYDPLASPAGPRPRHRRSGSISHRLQHITRTEPSSPESSTSSSATVVPTPDDYDSDTSTSSQTHVLKPTNPGPASTAPETPQQQQKSLLQVMLLEAGILFHSVFIGMALSVTSGPSFLILLLAIVFHQTFEGLALGSRIAALTVFPESSPKPWLMCLAYGTTTPIGQAIGLVTREMYDPASQTGLLMVGVMNAVSSGLLLFAGLVELLAEDFLTDESYVSLRGRRRWEACVAVGAGAEGMALVGAWA